MEIEQNIRASRLKGSRRIFKQTNGRRTWDETARGKPGIEKGKAAPPKGRCWGGPTSSTRPSSALANSPLPPPATAHPRPVITEDNVSILPLFCFLKAVLTQGGGVGRCHPVSATLGTLKTFQTPYWEIKWLDHLLTSQEDHSTSDWRAAPLTLGSAASAHPNLGTSIGRGEGPGRPLNYPHQALYRPITRQWCTFSVFSERQKAFVAQFTSLADCHQQSGVSFMCPRSVGNSTDAIIWLF